VGKNYTNILSWVMKAIATKKIKLVWQMTFQTKTLQIVVDAKKTTTHLYN
jgi:hypothetical protein